MIYGVLRIEQMKETGLMNDKELFKACADTLIW